MKTKQSITLDIKGNVENVLQGLDRVENAFKGLSGKNALPIKNKVDELARSLDVIKDKSSVPIKSMGTFDSISDKTIQAKSSMQDLNKTWNQLLTLDQKGKIKLLPEDEQKRINEILKNTKELEKIKKSIDSKNNKVANNKDNHKKSLEEEKRIQNNISTIQSDINKKKTEQSAYKQTTADLKAYIKALEYLKKYEGDNNPNKSKWEKTVQESQFSNLSIEQAKDGLKRSSEALTSRNTSIEADKAKLKQLQTDLSTTQKEIKKYQQAINDAEGENNEATNAIKKLAEQAQKLGVNIEGLENDSLSAEQRIELLTNALNTAANNGIEPVDVATKELGNELNTLETELNQVDSKVKEGTRSFEQQNEQMNQLQSIKSRIQHFIGLEGVIQLFRRAAQEALQTIKELDAQMTEMAVVTDLGIGDYWEQLPEYTARANELGISIKGAYEAATLFYQQGLKTNEVIEISNETLKMARIAGLNAEDATNKMTAALRGFNMELNKTSARNISDVYSELAAITASDVDEISSAMTKTASIASNAGMKFETTAAFLSQIIETTRESAETAGTALKTVIARFQELKKDPAEIGEVDGEVIDANKIESALRTVGVALRDSSGQFRDLDEVFLELASKWDTLDVNTQRYIATVAAGSRQQSRFIAMMSDYGRTQELVSAANSSAGASNRQFEKTLESLETKMARLSNAWAEFTMGIMNNALIKTGVDVLTTLLSIINKVTEGFGKSTSTLSKLGLIIAGFKMVQALFNKLTATITTSVTNMGNTLGQSIAQGITNGMNTGKQTIEQTMNNLNQRAKNSGQPLNGTEEQLEKKRRGVFGAIQGYNTSTNAATGLRESTEENKSILDTLGKNNGNPLEGTSIRLKQNSKVTNSILSSMEKQYKTKMGNMGATTEEINKGWKDYLKTIEKTEDGTINLSKETGKINQKLAEQADVSNNVETSNKQIVVSEEMIADAQASATETQQQYIQQSVEGYQQMTRGIQDTGFALTGLGVGFGMIGTYLEEAGLEKAGEIFSKFGTVLMFVGSVLTITSTLMGILTPLYQKFIVATQRATAAKIAETAAEGMSNAAKGSGIIATIAQTAANWSLFASMPPILAFTLLIVAAILAAVAVIMLLVAAFKAIKNSTPEAKLEAAQEAADRAAEAADRAAEAFQTLSDTLDSLEDKYEGLENLTKYTKEWKEAVQEINTEVMNLVDQYPELAAHVTSEGGILQLDTESAQVQAVLDSYELQKNQTSAMEMLEKINVNQKQADVYFDDLSNDATLGVTGWEKFWDTVFLNSVDLPARTLAGVSGTTANMWTKDQLDILTQPSEQDYRDLSDELAKALASGELGATPDETKIAEWLSDNGLKKEANVLAESLASASDELIDYGRSLLEMEAQNELYMQNIANSILSQLDLSDLDEEEIEAIEATLNTDYVEMFVDEATADFGMMSSSAREEAMEEIAKAKYGETAKVEKDGERIVYEDDEGEQEVEMTEAEWQRAYLAYSATKEAEAIEKLPDALKKLPKEIGNVFRGEEGSSLTKGNIETLYNEKGEFDVSKVEAAWDSLGANEREAFNNNYDYFLKQVTDSARIANEAWASAGEKMTNLGLKLPENYENLTTSAVTGFINKLDESAFKLFSERNQEEVMDTINSLTEGLDVEKTEEFYSILAALDWSSTEELEKLSVQLIDLGVCSEDSRDKIEELEDQLKNLAFAVTSMSFDEALNQLADFNQLIKEIGAGTQQRTFEEDAYKEIINALPDFKDQFVPTGNGEYYYQGSFVALQEALEQRGNDTLDSVFADIEARAGYFDETNQQTETFSTFEYKTTAEQKEYDELMRRMEYLVDNKDVLQKAYENPRAYADEVEEEMIAGLLGVPVDRIKKSSSGFTYHFEMSGESKTENLGSVPKIIDNIFSGFLDNSYINSSPEEVSYEVYTGINKTRFLSISEMLEWAKYNYGEWFPMLEYLSPILQRSDYGADESRKLRGDTYIDKQTTSGIPFLDIVQGIVDEDIVTKDQWEQGKGDSFIDEDTINTIFSNLFPELEETAKNWTVEQKYARIADLTDDDVQEITLQAQQEYENQKKATYFSQTTAQGALDDEKAQGDLKRFQAEALKEALEARVQARGGEQLAAQFDDKISTGLDDQEELLINALTSDFMDNQEKINTLGDALSEYSEVLVDAKEGTAEYSKAMAKVRDLLSSNFGVELTDEFMQQNSQLIQQVIAGNLEALGDLQGLMLSQVIKEVGLKTDSEDVEKTLTENLEDGAGSFNLKELAESVGLEVTGENTDSITDQIISMYKALGYTANIMEGTVVVAQNSFSDFAETLEEAKNDVWENPYDWLYDVNNELEQLMRQREKLESEYNDVIKKAADDLKGVAEDQKQTKIEEAVDDMIESTSDTIKVLEKQVETEIYKYAMAQNEINDLYKNNTNLEKYTRFDSETGQLLVDYEALDTAGFTAEEGEKFEADVDRISELKDVMWESEDALEEIKEVVEELKDRGKEETSELMDLIKEGIVATIQEQIDELTNINDTIKDAQDNLVNKIQEQIDDARQARENEKTEEDLLDKQRQLDYLKMDGGASQTAIKALEKEIEEMQEQYQDSLVDQAIQNLQDSNEKAAEQRERQIRLAEYQLEAYSTSQQIWEDTKNLMSAAFNESNNSLGISNQIARDQMIQLIATAEDVKAMNPIQKADFEDSLDTKIINSTYWTTATDFFGTGEDSLIDEFDDLEGKIDSANNFISQLQDKAGILGNVSIQSVVDEAFWTKLEDINFGDGFNQDALSTELGNILSEIKKLGTDPSPTPNPTPGPNTTPETYVPSQGTSPTTVNPVVEEFHGSKASLKYKYGFNEANTGYRMELHALEQTYMEKLMKPWESYEEVPLEFRKTILSEGSLDSLGMTEDEKTKYYQEQHFRLYDDLYNYYYDSLTHYKTGGIADFTGPAWLDGTKSRPELILNQRDTQNFIALKDILSDIMSDNFSSSQSKSSGGDNYFDIEINVENIEDDYDVEQMAEKIKSLIYSDATYRNANAIRQTR